MKAMSVFTILFRPMYLYLDILDIKPNDGIEAIREARKSLQSEVVESVTATPLRMKEYRLEFEFNEVLNSRILSKIFAKTKEQIVFINHMDTFTHIQYTQGRTPYNAIASVHVQKERLLKAWIEAGSPSTWSITSKGEEALYDWEKDELGILSSLKKVGGEIKLVCVKDKEKS